MTTSVLFVDDQQDILDILERVFADEAYELHFATSAQAALDLLDTTPVDVIVTDLMMPQMSGLELLRIVRGRHPRIVRVVLSGFSQVGTILEAINSGEVFRFITKPWRVSSEATDVLRQAADYADMLKIQVTPGAVVATLDQVRDALGERPYILEDASGATVLTTVDGSASDFGADARVVTFASGHKLRTPAS